MQYVRSVFLERLVAFLAHHAYSRYVVYALQNGTRIRKRLICLQPTRPGPKKAAAVSEEKERAREERIGKRGLQRK